VDAPRAQPLHKVCVTRYERVFTFDAPFRPGLSSFRQ